MIDRVWLYTGGVPFYIGCMAAAAAKPRGNRMKCEGGKP